MNNNAQQPTAKFAPEEALVDMEAAMEEAQVVTVEAEKVTVADDPTMVTEVEEAQEDIAKVRICYDNKT